MVVVLDFGINTEMFLGLGANTQQCSGTRVIKSV